MPVIDNKIISRNNPWQHDLTSRTDRLAYLYKTGMLSDVVFIVGKEKDRIFAHKLVLMMSSSVFETMFESGLSKCLTSSRRVEIELPDVKPKIFKAMLQFLYRGEFIVERNDLDGVMNLLVLANKYKLEHLKHQCLTITINGINETNVLSIYHLANLLGITDLKLYSSDFVCRNASLVLQKNGARKTLSPEQLKVLLMSDDFNIDEIELFNFVIEWAKEACKLINLSPNPESMKQMIGKLVPCIRFGLMEASDVSRYVTSQKIFNDDELVQIYVATTMNNKNRPDASKHYGAFPDCRPRNRYATLNRYDGRVLKNVGKPNWQCISFKVDRAIRMVGVGIFGVSSVVLGELFKFGPQYSYQIRILNSVGQTLVKQNGKLKYVGEIIPVSLYEPIDIQPETYYTIAVEFQYMIGKRFVGVLGRSQIEVPWMENAVNFEFKKTPANIFETKFDSNSSEAEMCGNVYATTDTNVGEIPQIHFTWLE